MDLVVLAGSVGKGVSWTGGCIKSLLPLPVRSTLIEALVSRFDTGSSKNKCIICSDGHKDQFVESIRTNQVKHLELDFFEDTVPLGTAGCLKACELLTSSSTIMLAGGSVWLDDDPQWMLEEHRRAGNALTVFCTKDAGWASAGSQRFLRPAGLFCCDRSVLKYIRPSGFQDLKEQLVPALKRAGLRVGAVALPGGTCEVSELSTYLSIIARVLAEGRFHINGFARIAPDIWCGRGIHIASHARIVGPVLLGHGCKIEDGAVIVGPTMLGDGSHVGRGARLIRVVAQERLRARSGLLVTDRVFPPATHMSKAPAAQPATLPKTLVRRALAFPGRAFAPATAVGLVLLTAFVWSFWASITSLWTYLGTNPDYSAGQLVPVAAMYMVTVQKRRGQTAFQLWWPGVIIFLTGLLANVAGHTYRYSSLENFGLITSALGMIASIVGKNVCTRLWYPLLFLFLMVPLPNRLHGSVTFPLQTWGANIAATVLETMGIPAIQNGNVMQVGGQQIAVAEACSGLRMVLAFLLVTGVVAYVIDRPIWQKAVVLLSSIPIALICNALRLIFSAYLISIGRANLAQGAFHDGAGLIMMPVAIALVFIEFWVLSNLVVPQGGVTAIVEVVDDRVQRSGTFTGGYVGTDA